MSNGSRSPRATIVLLALAGALGGCAAGTDHRTPVAGTVACAGAASTPPTVSTGAAAPGTRAAASSLAAGYVRVNQVGYGARCVKAAFLLASRPMSEAFTVIPSGGGAPVLAGFTGAAVGSVNARWPYVYRLNLDALRRSGRYVVAVAGLRSPVFTVGDPAVLYRPLVDNAVSFFRSQRDGADVPRGPLGRRPSHLLDRNATVYRTPPYRGTRLLRGLQATPGHIDAAGGWFDAGDYLKFVETASFNEALLALTLREYPHASASPQALRAEVRFGAQWLMQMWDAPRGVLYNQVGLGDGNANTILGDHDLWRLPQADDRRRVGLGSASFYVGHRPVFAANAPGAKLSPNLAGRTAGALALCAQVLFETDPAFARRGLLAAQQIYAAADHRPAALVSTVPRAYYAENEWRDDLEFGAVELFLATQRLGGEGMLHRNPYVYLPQATDWADAYAASPSNGRDSLNLYDVSSLAHYDLIGILRSRSTSDFAEIPGVSIKTDTKSLLSDLHDGLILAQRLGAQDAFGLSNPATNVDTVPHALGYAIQARLYDRLTRSSTFEGLAQTEMGWALGANPWGSSFIVGAGSVFPHCLAHQVANLSGSLNGARPILAGATVDGPNASGNLGGLGAPDGYRRCPAGASSPFSAFDGHATGYLDDVRSSSTSEPASDYTALALLALAQQAGQ